VGFLDKLKDKAKEVKEKAVETVDEHSPQIKGGISKAGDFVDKKTKGKYADKIAKGTRQAEAAVDKIKADDPHADVTPTPPHHAGPAAGVSDSTESSAAGVSGTVTDEPIVEEPAMTQPPTEPATPPPGSDPGEPGTPPPSPTP
jgi:hypothetical protein